MSWTLAVLMLLACPPGGQPVQNVTSQPSTDWIRVETIRTGLRPTSAPAARHSGPTAAPFRAQTLDGEMVDFPGQYRDRLVLLIFWASWCDECAAELPAWRDAYERFHPAGLDMLGLACDQRTGGRVEDVLAYVAANAVAWPNVFDEASDVARQYQVDSLPALFLVDGATGRVVAQGAALRGVGVIRQVAARLRAAPPPATSRPAGTSPSE